MKSRIFNFSAFLLLVTLLVFSACKKEFDEPPIGELPNLHGNASIASVVAMASTSPVALTDQILEAIVIADDKSGNFYKQLVIQDSTGGIRLDIDAYDIYNDFPIGRKVWIKCKGLFIWRDGDVPALIGSSNTNDSRIPAVNYKKFIIGGEYNNPVTPKVKTLSTLTPADYHTLVQLDNVEFADCFAGGTYAFPTTQQSKNAELTECSSGGMVIVRNSGFASFAGELMPAQNGSIIAVFNSFGGTSQLFIRNPTDCASMTNTRCTPLASYADVSITALRAQFTGSATQAVGKIRGVVISDATTGQWNSKNIVIQEPNGSGITIRFDADHGFAQNDYVEVKVGGGTLSLFNGLLQLATLPICRANVVAGSASITPRVATIANILANSSAWESTLVQVQNASLNGGATYGDFNIKINDATGNMSLFSAFSNFKTAPIPTGTGSVTAVLGNYNGFQLNIRNLNDVAITGGGGSGGTNLNRISIQAARNLFTGTATTAPDTTKIVGIVISDLVGGNWVPQNMVIQEPNGAGILVRFASNHNFNKGDEVQVNISNMAIEEYQNLLQINGVPNANATVLSTGNSITPRTTTVSAILANANAWESTLIKVFNATLTGGTTYASFNLMLNDPSGSISFFSAFSNFKTSPVPTGTGDVTGVVGDHTNGVQINIRNTSDVNFTGGGGGTNTFMTIAAVRALFTGTATTVPANRSIKGIVISDITNKNITDKNIVIQETGGSGIVVRFAANNTTIMKGDSVTINISSANLSEFNGLLQVDGVANSGAVVVSSGNNPAPRVATIQAILTNAEAWESTLVKINGATIASGTYGGTKVVTDATGTVDMFTRTGATGATFATGTVPSGTVSVTAIVSQFTTYQINIRNTTDVQ